MVNYLILEEQYHEIKEYKNSEKKHLIDEIPLHVKYSIQSIY